MNTIKLVPANEAARFLFLQWLQRGEFAPSAKLELMRQWLQEYRHYISHPAFFEGFTDYRDGTLRNPHDTSTVAAQAWDRGANAAMQLERLKR